MNFHQEIIFQNEIHLATLIPWPIVGELKPFSFSFKSIKIFIKISFFYVYLKIKIWII